MLFQLIAVLKSFRTTSLRARERFLKSMALPHMTVQLATPSSNDFTAMAALHGRRNFLTKQFKGSLRYSKAKETCALKKPV